MASLNLSINGPSIKSSYNGVVSAPPPSSSSPTYAQWALFSVQAPLLNAFQDGGAKESILKVQSTGEGELQDLTEDFSEGRIQFAFVKVKDPNSGLPKSVLIAWCGGGVPERTKGYFTSHVAAVSKILHGYHVQITARSDNDLDPASIMQKVADASGAKYSASGSSTTTSSARPPVKTKPVFTPTSSSAGRSVNPLVAARSKRDDSVDADGWGADAPQVTRSQLEKVEPAYRPTKVDMSQLTKQAQEPSRFDAGARRDETSDDVVRGGYQPIGKVDIAAIRAQAQKAGDDRPTPVKGAYEPVGKVDIAAIRAKSQKPAQELPVDAPEPKPVADRAAAFSQPSQSERLTSLPKPKVANKFGGASTFTGTKAPVPGALGFGSPAIPAPAPVGGASRTFADEGGKTPAQIWAEKKARERGEDSGSSSAPVAAPAVTAQASGSEWKSGYSGKSWATVQTSKFGGAEADAVGQEHTGGDERDAEEESTANAGGVSALRDRFKNTAPIGSAAPPPAPREAHANDDGEDDDYSAAPPHHPATSRPAGGFSLPGLPSRPPPVDDEEEEEEEPATYESRDQSPIRIAAPVARSAEPVQRPESPPAPPSVPVSQIHVPAEEDLSDEREAAEVARGAASGVVQQNFTTDQIAAGEADHGGKRALIQYDYEKAEANEIDLVDGEYVTNIEMVDEDWWMGTNSQGESGLFPSNYVELIEDDEPHQAAAPASPPAPAAPAAARHTEPEAPEAPASGGATATALYDYEAAEDNELSFPEDATITNLEFPDEDWWYGQYNGHTGLFPANYVQRD